MNRQRKMFHISDILSITTGRLVSNRHMNGIYDILNFMTNDNLYTHQLGRASDECKPELFRQHPQLATYSGEDITSENVQAWLEARIKEFGEELSVQRLPENAHEVRDPISEMAEMMGGTDNIIVAAVPEPSDEE